MLRGHGTDKERWTARERETTRGEIKRDFFATLISTAT
jgi:hypothetical protein